MRHLIVTVAMVATALVVTFGLAALLEHAAFRAGPEPGVGTPAGTPPPGDRRGRTGRQLV